MKKVVVVLALMLTSSLTFAQDAPTDENGLPKEEKESKFAAAVDVVAPYLWRGIKYSSNKVAFQPYASYAFTDKLTVGVWGTTNFSSAADAYNEFDWYVSYQVTPLMKVMLSDYYWPATKKAYEEDNSNSRDPYFDYSEGSAQTLDLSILFDFSDKGVPLDFQWNTIVGGNDYDADGNRAFSSYAEAGYTYSWEKPGLDFRPFVGAVVINGGYYGEDEEGNIGAFFSNVGLNVAKEIKFSEKFSVPVFIRYTYNEYGYENEDGEWSHNFISGGVTFTIK
ncbi:TorF family putative porin [Flavobacterium sp. N3904]|uniref:TorF family putative porin n=1 Tax=Flavobacterium sp. N3904 TaxID=2986835 RepID=UPI002224365D|nr:TorF family putative porin [Flavobacterium sp. N3904]